MDRVGAITYTENLDGWNQHNFFLGSDFAWNKLGCLTYFPKRGSLLDCKTSFCSFIL